MVKNLNLTVEALEHRFEPIKIDKVQELLDAQHIIDGITVTNGDIIKRIYKEIEELVSKKKQNKKLRRVLERFLLKKASKILLRIEMVI